MVEAEIKPFVEIGTRNLHIADGPIDFATWVALPSDIDCELVGGVLVDRMVAYHPHESLFNWLSTILTNYVADQDLGIVLGSRTALKITNYDGRLPDIVFVRSENRRIVKRDAIHGVPDLVIEILSENDRRNHIVQLESDYYHVGVPEIVFIDPRKKHVRYIRKAGSEYVSSIQSSGKLEFTCVPGFWIELEWLFTEDRPKPLTMANELIAAQQNR